MKIHKDVLNTIKELEEQGFRFSELTNNYERFVLMHLLNMKAAAYDANQPVKLSDLLLDIINLKASIVPEFNSEDCVGLVNNIYKEFYNEIDAEMSELKGFINKPNKNTLEAKIEYNDNGNFARVKYSYIYVCLKLCSLIYKQDWACL